ncbi:helix-turn-helix domain-containing protein [Tundrisphaera lichenicola]|uniref:helix-turn-helix domain-containing protein n=1 Tax=Tundrisphaera lichenicola TaxID=2029860 RepID=UPI003EBFAD06
MMAEKKLWKNCNRFSEKLGQKILQLGLNGQRLARKSDVSDSEISRIMNGKSLPGLENAISLARAVGVSLDYLADDALETDPSQPKESADENETTIQRLAREIGFKQAEYILEYTRIVGYEVAMHRLVEAKPVISPLIETNRPVVAPIGVPGRVNTA